MKSSEGGEFNENDKGVDGEEAVESGSEQREVAGKGNDRSGSERSEKSILSICSRTKRRPSCLRYGKTHRPNIDPTQLDKHKRAVGYNYMNAVHLVRSWRHVNRLSRLHV